MASFSELMTSKSKFSFPKDIICPEEISLVRGGNKVWDETVVRNLAGYTKAALGVVMACELAWADMLNEITQYPPPVRMTTRMALEDAIMSYATIVE
jgi:hypothetical protein